MIVELDDYSLRDALTKPFVAGRPNYVVIPTNEQNVHGAGAALVIRNAFPQLEAISRQVVMDDGDFEKGAYLHVANTNDEMIKIVLMPTKESPKDQMSSMRLISMQLLLLYEIVGDKGTVVMPKVGCGLGKLNWKMEVGPFVAHMQEKHAPYNSTVIATKRFEIATMRPGMNEDLKVLDYTIYNAARYKLNPYIVWFGFTEDGAVQYMRNLGAVEPIYPEDAFTSLRYRGIVEAGKGSRRVEQEHVFEHMLENFHAWSPTLYQMLYGTPIRNKAT